MEEKKHCYQNLDLNTINHVITISKLPIGKSSSNYPNSRCQDGFQNKNREGFGSMWYSSSEGIGAWIQVSFKGVFMVTKFEFVNRSNPNERNKSIELEFSDGSKQLFELINSDKKLTFNVKKVQTQYIIVRIKQVYGTINNGGCFNFYGIECKNLKNQTKMETTGILKAAGINPNAIAPLFKDTTIRIIGLSCRESFSNSKKFRRIKMGLGNSVIVNCFTSCATSIWAVYGTGKYTKDSAICKAAFHDKKITSIGGQVIN